MVYTGITEMHDTNKPSEVNLQTSKPTEEMDSTPTPTDRNPSSNTRSTNATTPQAPKRSRKHSQVSSPLLSPDDSSAPPSEARMVQLLADAIKPLQDKLDDLIENQNIIHEQAEHFHSSINELKLSNKQMESRICQLEQENRDLKDRVIHQEAQSRRNNFRFHGLTEEKFDNAEENVLRFLQSNGLNFHPRRIERDHRLGHYTQGKTRPIIVRFMHFKGREVVWRKLGHGLIPPNIKKPHVREDFHHAVDDCRSQLLPVAVAATKMRDPTSQKPLKVQLVVDRLYINNQRCTKDSMDSHPDTLHPRNIHTPSNGNKTAFFSRHSPLSNHFLSPFTVNGENFNCLEQYMMVQKARLFGDQNVVRKVMTEILPPRQKQAGRSIHGFDQGIWTEAFEEKIFPSLLAKFDQNPVCKDTLIQTGDNVIIEANPYDKFWGAGLSLHSPDLWNLSKHTGKNVMGKCLQRVRQQLISMDNVME